MTAQGSLFGGHLTLALSLRLGLAKTDSLRRKRAREESLCKVGHIQIVLARRKAPSDDAAARPLRLTNNSSASFP